MMKKIYFLLLVFVSACNSNERKVENKIFSKVEIEMLSQDSISIRAIEIMGNNVAFAGDDGKYGLYNANDKKIKMNRQEQDSVYPEFRAVASTSEDFFMLSVANPALLYKTGDDGSMKLVYKEENEKVFYDSMVFWNATEGIAMGDPIGDCLSIIITRDAGNNWEKISCEDLPKTQEGEAAFAASNSNISVQGAHTWIVTGGSVSRVFYSGDKGKTWQVFNTPIVSGKATTGIYSVDFYDQNTGIIFGGDYTQPDEKDANKAITQDGGKTWKLVAAGEEPGYKSCVRFVPNGEGKEIVAVGFTGISYSKDWGDSWEKLSDEGFYTIRFLNDSVAYAAGKNKLAKLKFKQ